MNRNMLTIVCISVALTGSLIPSPGASGQEGDVEGVHDPCVIKEGAYYYVFSTRGGIMVRKSADLKNWKRDGQVLPGVPAWAKSRVPDARDLWAPDISFFDGQYRLYYSISSWGKNRSCIGLATNKTLDRTSPLFRWVDEGLVIDSMPGRDKFNAIDPNVTLDQDGKPWLSFGSFFSGIHMVRLDQKSGKPAGSTFPIAGRNGGAIEAPFIIREGEYYYLFVSFDQCCKGVNSTYKIMAGRSRQVTGPYVDDTGGKLLDGGGTLVLKGYGRIRGPGHNSVLREGHHVYLVHHFYNAANGGRPTLQIRPLVWGKDGWPLAGEPMETTAKLATNKGSILGTWEHSFNFDPGQRMTLLPDGTINPGTKNTWRVIGSSLQLRWYRDDAPEGVWVEDCVVSPDVSWFVGRNQHGTIIRGVKIPSE